MNIINSVKNKEMLWNVLYEKNIFNKLPNTSLIEVKNIFENELLKKINNINNHDTDIDLIDINKEILHNVIIKINEYKNNRLENKIINRDTKEEIQKLKLDKFNEEFENKKLSMSNILNPTKPSELEFSDKLDKPLSSDEMNNMINLLEKNRNIEVDMSMNIIKKEIDYEKKNIDVNNKDEYIVPKLKINNIESLINDLNIIDIKENNFKKIVDEEYNGERIFNENVNVNLNLNNIENKKENTNKLNESIILNKINAINQQLDNVLKNQITIMNYLNIN